MKYYSHQTFLHYYKIDNKNQIFWLCSTKAWKLCWLQPATWWLPPHSYNLVELPNNHFIVLEDLIREL
jgi:hypothetical protein